MNTRVGCLLAVLCQGLSGSLGQSVCSATCGNLGSLQDKAKVTLHNLTKSSPLSTISNVFLPLYNIPDRATIVFSIKNHSHERNSFL